MIPWLQRHLFDPTVHGTAAPDATAQRGAELQQLFGKLEHLRDQCIEGGQDAPEFRQAAIDILEMD